MHVTCASCQPVDTFAACWHVLLTYLRLSVGSVRGLRPMPAAVESTKRRRGRGSGRRAVVRCGCVRALVGWDGCEVRLCDPCARVCPCVPCVSRLPRCFLPVVWRGECLSVWLPPVFLNRNTVRHLFSGAITSLQGAPPRRARGRPPAPVGKRCR